MIVPDIAQEVNVKALFDDFISDCPRCITTDARTRIYNAFEVAAIAHKGQRRASGEPFIMHPIAVARIVSSEIGLGVKGIIAALLHDVLETDTYSSKKLDELFGPKVLYIIEGLTKLPVGFSKNTSNQAENYRKLLLTLSDDVRVVLIKLAARLHNIRTLSVLSATERTRIAAESLDLYAPLAHRLGLNAIKTEMEDLSLRYLHTEAYTEITTKVRLGKEKRTALIDTFTAPIRSELDKMGLKYSISGRTKSTYSIWKKMKRKNVPFEEVFDLFAVRIVFDANSLESERNQCFSIYSLITDKYPPKPDRFRDWVTLPKENGYEALHTTVFGPDAGWIEVQVRTTRMDEIAERGYAAHWKYKNGETRESGLERWIKRTKEILKNPDANALETLDDFKLNLFTSEIMVFTPKGEIISLPKAATVLDFAFEIHSDMGFSCMGAQINQKLVKPDHVLQTGDQVKLLTSAKQEPETAWLKYVVTAKAQAYLKQHFRISGLSKRELGQEKLHKVFEDLNTSPNSKIIKKILTELNLKSKGQLYNKIGKGTLDIEEVKQVIAKKQGGKFVYYKTIQFNQQKQSAYKIAPKVKAQGQFIHPTCCRPLPGEKVVGVKSDHGIILHSSGCPTAIHSMAVQAEKIVRLKWITSKLESFPAKIKLRCSDRQGLLLEITRLLTTEWDVSLDAINMRAEGLYFEGEISVYIHNVSDLHNLMNDLMTIKGMEMVTRTDT